MQETTTTWMKVFHHDSRNGYFTSNEEANFSDTPGKYSKLSLISDEMKIDGFFEFRLEYPLNGYVYQWKQAENPLTVYNGDLNSSDYSQILNPPSKGKWRGFLSRSTLPECTLLDGITGKDWWFSIGAIECSDIFITSYKNLIPGPSGVAVKEVTLWIKLGNIKNRKELIGYFSQMSIIALII